MWSTVRGRERSTLHDYRNSINFYLNPRWGELPVDAITPTDVEELRDELMKTEPSSRTVVRHLTVAHGVFKHAMR
jgi:site-specific recombinase XerD